YEARADRRELDLVSEGTLDAHARAHANDIQRRFANRNGTTGQIVMFALAGGLVPCGAAVTVLLLCLQTGRFVLGVALVLCFSIGLALPLVAVGAAAAFGAQHAGRGGRGRSIRRAARGEASAVVRHACDDGSLSLERADSSARRVRGLRR